MGAGGSSMVGGEGPSRPGGLADLPESCVASVLVNLGPTEICRLAVLNRAFRGAATADSVWRSKLPENYAFLLEKAESDRVRRKGVTKKEIYQRLCWPNPLDEGRKVFWLEKSKGGFCMSISSKALSITGIDDRRYWNYIPSEESRFQTVAYLQQIWWFEVDGEVEFCFPAGTYSVFFRLQLGRPSKRLGWRYCDSKHVHGWDKKPVRFQLSTSNMQEKVTQCYLNEPGKWIHYHVGDFIVKNSIQPTKVKFSMVQIDCTHTKGGLCLDSVLLVPSHHRPANTIMS